MEQHFHGLHVTVHSMEILSRQDHPNTRFMDQTDAMNWGQYSGHFGWINGHLMTRMIWISLKNHQCLWWFLIWLELPRGLQLKEYCCRKEGYRTSVNRWIHKMKLAIASSFSTKWGHWPWFFSRRDKFVLQVIEIKQNLHSDSTRLTYWKQLLQMLEGIYQKFNIGPSQGQSDEKQLWENHRKKIGHWGLLIVNYKSE